MVKIINMIPIQKTVFQGKITSQKRWDGLLFIAQMNAVLNANSKNDLIIGQIYAKNYKKSLDFRLKIWEKKGKERFYARSVCIC